MRKNLLVMILFLSPACVLAQATPLNPFDDSFQIAAPNPFDENQAVAKFLGNCENPAPLKAKSLQAIIELQKELEEEQRKVQENQSRLDKELKKMEQEAERLAKQKEMDLLLIAAIEKQDVLEMAKALLKGASPNVYASDGRPAIFKILGNFSDPIKLKQAIKLLLGQEGIDVNPEYKDSRYSYTPLTYYLFYNNPLNLDLVKLLIESGAKDHHQVNKNQRPGPQAFSSFFALIHNPGAKTSEKAPIFHYLLNQEKGGDSKTGPSKSFLDVFHLVSNNKGAEEYFQGLPDILSPETHFEEIKSFISSNVLEALQNPTNPYLNAKLALARKFLEKYPSLVNIPIGVPPLEFPLFFLAANEVTGGTYQHQSIRDLVIFLFNHPQIDYSLRDSNGKNILHYSFGLYGTRGLKYALHLLQILPKEKVEIINLNAKDSQGATPLQYFVGQVKNQIKILKLQYREPLQGVAIYSSNHKKENQDALKTLLLHGADPRKKNEKGQNIYLKIIKNNHSGLSSILKKHIEMLDKRDKEAMKMAKKGLLNTNLNPGPSESQIFKPLLK